MMPWIGMFALLAVGGLAAGVGAFVDTRRRRNARGIAFAPADLEENPLLPEVHGPVE